MMTFRKSGEKIVRFLAILTIASLLIPLLLLPTKSVSATDYPTVPVITWPGEGEIISDYTPTITWNASSGGVPPYTYRIMIDNDQDFATPIVDVPGISGTSYQCPTLAGGLYYMRVRAIDDQPEVSDDSQIIFIINTKPVCSEFTTGAQVNPTNIIPWYYQGNPCVTFSWCYNDIDGNTGTKKQVQVGVCEGDNSMWDAILDAESIPDLYEYQMYNQDDQATPLSRGVIYYVRVREYDGYEWSAWVSGTFKLNQLPSTTDLKTEGLINPTELTTFTPTFSWSYLDNDDDAQSNYQIQVGVSENDNSIWGNTGTTLTQITYSGNTLSRDVTYYIRVRVKDGIEWSSWANGTFMLSPAPIVIPPPVEPVIPPVPEPVVKPKPKPEPVTPPVVGPGPVDTDNGLQRQRAAELVIVAAVGAIIFLSMILVKPYVIKKRKPRRRIIRLKEVKNDV